jgi:hypothetical protein
MRHDRTLAVGILGALLTLAAAPLGASPPQWPPVTDEEKALKDCSQQPGAPAIYLYREEIRNDNDGTRAYYCRMKILTTAGKERANIEIPYAKGSRKVDDLEARVVRPNGSVVPFAGQMFDKTALRAGKFRITVKTFAIPDVDVGDIIDYRYKIVPDSGGSSSDKGLELLENLFGVQGKPHEGGIAAEEGVYFIPIDTWEVQEDLFTRKAKFAYEPSDFVERLLSAFLRGLRLNWVTHNMSGRKPERKQGRVELELENIPAFEPEEYMTPESSQRMEVRLFYLEGKTDSPEKYWKAEGKNWQKGAEKFLQKSGDAPAEAQRLVSAINEPAARLRALYTRAQEIKNLSYDRTMTKQRRKELKIKDNHSVADVLKNNYGWRSDITRTFAAMATAAGFQAKVIRVSTRDNKLFDKNACGLYSQFDTELAMVRLNGKDLLFDPATPYCPIGLVRWSCSGTICLVPSDNPPAFLTTPVYPPDTALIQRELALRLDAEGNLAGSVKVTYTGQEALVRRLDHIGDDEVEVKKDLETEMAEILPTGAKATLKKVENMTNSADRITADFDIAVPGMVTSAGQRTLLPVSPLLGGSQHPFQHAQRKYPVYFPYPRREFNDIIMALPAGTKVETSPAPRTNRSETFDYTLVCVVEGGTKIHVQRDLVVKKSFFPVDQYPTVKSFFDQVRAGDEEQVVLAPEKK